MNDQRDQRNLLERFLGIFTEVRAGEGYLTVAMAFLVFLLLAAYYLIRPARAARMRLEVGAEHQADVSAVMVFLLYFLVPFGCFV